MGRGRAAGGARAAGKKASSGTKERKAAEKEHFGPSKAEVRYDRDYVSAHDRAVLDKRIENVFGRRITDRELASLVGAPDSAIVTLQEGGLTNKNAFILSVNSSEMSALRTIRRTAKGEIVIHNDIFVSYFPKAGLGTKVFGQQVEQAAKLGASRIETTAARSSTYNGYYTWARLGYDAKIPARVRSKLPAGMKKANNVSDLMKTEAGRSFWKEHGVQTDMTFDLKPGSLNRRNLNDYIQSKGR